MPQRARGTTNAPKTARCTHLGRLLLDGQNGVGHPNSHTRVVRLRERQADTTRQQGLRNNTANQGARGQEAAHPLTGKESTTAKCASHSAARRLRRRHSRHATQTCAAAKQTYRACHGQDRGRVLHAIHHAESLQVVHLHVAVQGTRHEARLAAIQAQRRNGLEASNARSGKNTGVVSAQTYHM